MNHGDLVQRIVYKHRNSPRALQEANTLEVRGPKNATKISARGLPICECASFATPEVMSINADPLSRLDLHSLARQRCICLNAQLTGLACASWGKVRDGNRNNNTLLITPLPQIRTS